MYDTYNPWTGCERYSEGCANCYMFPMENRWSRNGSFKINKTVFTYPIKKDRYGNYKVIPGSKIRVCMMSDFLFSTADPYREEIWKMIATRNDVEFYLLTKRPQRFMDTTPDWALTLENYSLNVSCENQIRTDKRLSILRDIPIAHKGIMAAPLLEEIHIKSYLYEGWIENVQADGERGAHARECRYEWFESLSHQCAETNTKFTVIGVGSKFYNKEGKLEKNFGSGERKNTALDLSLNVAGTEPIYKGIPASYRLIGEECWKCGAKPICNGLNPLTGKCN